MKRKSVKKKSVAAQSKNRDQITLRVKRGDDPVPAEAALHLRPTVQAAVTIRAYTKGKDGNGPDTDAMISELCAQAEAVASGDMRRPEAILVAQAHTLDSIFGKLARRAIVQENLPQYEAHMRLALKAQSQCARTLEVLANLKNPAAVAFVRQANIGNAVQVNNGQPSRAQDRIQNQSNELLGASNGERLELGTQGATSGANSDLAAVDSINGTKDS
jgi:hypothetical protein